MVVVDTNVLLNLYRYDDDAREDLFKVLEALNHRLFIPHQVILEFWRNRENVLRDRLDTAQLAAERLEEGAESARQVVREWANRLAIADDDRTKVLADLSGAFDRVTTVIDASAGSAEEADTRDTSEDQVLKRLETLLAGKVGRALPEDEHRKAVQEGRRRVDARIPPGFKDKDKDKEGDALAGDFLVWEQALREAEGRGSDAMVFVTGDTTGDDWWRRERGELLGPRIELYAEARDRAGVELFMFRPQSLVFHAQQALHLDIEADTVSKIGRAEERATADTAEGWTRSTIGELLARLRHEGRVQYEAVLAAVGEEGFVGRDRVYELGGYEPNRTLRGFTRPARRIMQDMQDAGRLSSDVAEPLATVYDPDYSAVHASGFVVPDEFLPILSSGVPGEMELDES